LVKESESDERENLYESFSEAEKSEYVMMEKEEEYKSYEESVKETQEFLDNMTYAQLE